MASSPLVAPARTRAKRERARGPRRTANQVELATAARVAWWNAEPLPGACGDIPPDEFEAAYHHRLQASEAA
jgi:putative transposase